MTVTLAWRNLMRNKRRTFIAGTAIGIGLAGLIFVDALVIGMEENMVRTVTASYLGEAQIHARGYRDTPEVETTLASLDSLVRRLDSDPRVAAFTPRLMSPAMVSSAANLGAILLTGVEPGTERLISQVDDTMVSGTFFAEDNPQDIVIGWKLAELLEVDIGDRVVVTVAQAGSGHLSQELFCISGIFRFGAREMDQLSAFVRLSKARQMLNLPLAAHQIALTFHNPALARDGANGFWADYSTEGNQAVGWPVIVPQLRATFELSNISLAVISTILLAAVALSILNTLFMAVYERMFEFGVLRALGTRASSLCKLILAEAALLGLISCLLGMLLGLTVTAAFARLGIDYRGIEMIGLTVRDLIYPVIQTRQFTLYPLLVLAFATLIGIYPAVHAARIPPADALRKSL